MSRAVIRNEDLQVYVRDFGQKVGDRCLVAEMDGKAGLYDFFQIYLSLFRKTENSG